jgi:hypothetical protein
MSAGTVRNKILDYVVAKLPNIKVENGYNFTMAKSKSGYFKSKAVTEYPCACSYFGADLQSQNIEGEFTGVNTIDLMVLVYMNTPIEDQAKNAELIIQDLLRFLKNDSSIDPLYSINLMDIKYVQDYTVVEITPYLTGDNNIMAIGVILKVEYINFLDQLIPYTPTLVNPYNGSGNVGSES